MVSGLELGKYEKTDANLITLIPLSGLHLDFRGLDVHNHTLVITKKLFVILDSKYHMQLQIKDK